MIRNIIERAVLTANDKEEFTTNDSVGQRTMDLVASVVTLVVILLILALLGKYLWNEVVAGSGDSPGLIKGVREADNIWQILGLYILLSLLIN